METANIIALASQMSEAFEGGTRDNGDTFRKLRDGSPEWMSDVAFAAHMDGEFFPSDWIYGKMESAIDRIARADEFDDLDDMGHEFADGAADVYNGALAAWLADHMSNAGYVDSATEEFGPSDGIYASIQRGQYAFLSDMWGQVVRALETVAEDMPESEDA